MNKEYRMMRLLIAASFLLAIGCKSSERSTSPNEPEEQLINKREVERIITVIAADDMKGRLVYTPEIDKAADFIASEFESIGLEKWDGLPSYKQEFERVPGKKLANVVGIIPGKSRRNEYVIFSAHYDHIGVAKRSTKADTIYNGANDNASGVTAVILLAKYFKDRGDNERTLVFVAFTGEETGGFWGSTYFSGHTDPEQVIAMLNIEMIGTRSTWGRSSVFMTGIEKSNLGAILQENLKGAGFFIQKDPYPMQQLFSRSDNLPFARLGVPAHTITSAQIDYDQDYHQVTDEIKTIDLENMVRVIRGIAICAGTIISGKDTPTRINTTKLQ